MASAKRKQPKSKELPNPRKEVRTGPQSGQYHELVPAWRVAQMRLTKPFSWHEIDRQKFQNVICRLGSFETMTWREILVVGSKRNHLISADKLEKSARECLEEAWQGADEVISLGLTGKERIFGIMDRGAFTILWWDPDHEVCPSLLRNT